MSVLRAKHLYKKLLPLCLCGALGSTVLAVSADEQAEYEARMQQLQRNIEQLQTELKKTQGSRDKLKDQLEESESDIGELLKRIQNLESEMKQQDNDLQSLRQRRQELDQSRQAQQTAVAEQVRSAYQLGRQSQLKLLLNQESPQRVSRLLRYHDYWLEARTDLIHQYLDTLAELDDIEPRIVQKTTELASSRDQLKQQHNRLSSRQSERRETLAALNQRIRSTDQELNDLQKDRERLQALLDEMVAAVADLEMPGGDVPFSQSKGQLPWPASGKLRYRFGSTQLHGQITRQGIVISASEGTPVLAVHHGRVVFSDYFRGHGLLLIVDHGEGYMTLYAHNQALYKETGEWVAPGETIASVGSTGGQTEAGLYFELRYRGKPTNPAPWLAQA
ncbi:murein hydrolase activator EnvC family protein [Marinimicrobium sp. ARAG 43.8]|uniref:murein hydrolase activator EnvC family protein n=1 Tax=Marinimicrobium sp. ARAG 43.8 TaxID=3418719 RepID=UPI003CF3A248